MNSPRVCSRFHSNPLAPGTQQVLNTVPRTATGRRAQWGSDPREELYKQLVEEQEEKNKELFAENDHLRHWYVTWYIGYLVAC